MLDFASNKFVPVVKRWYFNHTNARIEQPM